MTTTVPLITLQQGEGRTITPKVETSALLPDDITNFLFTWKLWHVLTGTVLEKTIGDGITILMPQTGDTKGKLSIYILPTDTTDLAPLTYEQKLEMSTLDESYMQVMMQGYIQISSVRPVVPV